ncbi:MAG: DMT family transporter [Bacteroidetes bacterium]|nr:MAG: DMT family transporter [Bacteroidota bacterium]TAF98270.1 MAG: DMT family transporter [Bacteroidota bacterium]
MQKILPILLALLLGGLLPIQATINGKLGKTMGSPIVAAVISFAVGMVLILLYAMVTKTPLNLPAAKDTQWYYWLGGIIGVLYVTAIIYLVPILGAGLAFALIVAGQMCVSVWMDKMGFLGISVVPLTPQKIAGLVLILIGVFLLKK